MNTDVPMATPASSETGSIAFDLQCANCGYNLCGLQPNGSCPECAKPIEFSLRDDLLQFADPTWLRRLHMGVQLLLWCIAISILMGIIGGAASVKLGSPMIALTVPTLAALTLYVVAVFCLTSREPRDTGAKASATLRKTIRVSVLLLCLSSLMNLLKNVIAANLFFDLTASVLQLAGSVAMLGILVYLRRFALRIPDEKLAQSTRTVMWGTIGSYAIFLIIGIVASSAGLSGATTPSASGPAVAAFFGIGCIGGVVVLVFALWYIRLLYRYRDAFKLAAEKSTKALSAKQHAASEGAHT